MKEHIERLLAELAGPDEETPGISDPELLKDWNRRAETAIIFAWVESLSLRCIEKL